MKKIISISIFTFLVLSICNAQILEDYPFKTYLDSADNIYVTGFKQIGMTKELFTAKYPPNENSPALWSRVYENPNGDDRGLDIAVDSDGNTFVTGYTFNSILNNNDIIVMAYNPDGTFKWSKIFENPGDDKGMGIDLKLNEDGQAMEVFITGFMTSRENRKNYLIKKLSATNGALIWQNTYGVKFGDNIATDILIDNDFAYVLGYSYFGPQRLNDIALLTFYQDNGSLQEALFDNRPGTDEKPTGFLIAERSHIPVQKSRIALTSNTDNHGNGNSGKKYLTMFLDRSSGNAFNIKWSREFSNSSENRNDAVTSICRDNSGDIYISGYALNTKQRYRGMDFITAKYTADSGNYGWTENTRMFNYSDTSSAGVNDRASSIKVNNQKTVYVAGVSEASPSGYSYVQYIQSSGQPVYELDRMFIPNFINSDRDQGQFLNKWATIHIADDGTPLMVVMGWNENEAHWAAIRYDADGNVLYTINNESGITDKSFQKKENAVSLNLNNYPNPFNPSTVISYELSANGFVNLKIYDITGREVASLINENQTSGSHSVSFNAGDLSNGVYYYFVSVNGVKSRSKSMILLK
ncbi:MAG TPA: T9SS type A sorting domain-containing protein [Ignavibacteria bacterium]|nr:T9SS type A sorting domain-containing protein [Ignavibacteria bacterium]